MHTQKHPFKPFYKCMLHMAFLFLSACTSLSKQENCFDTTNAVTLTATLSEKTFAGPPNFHSIELGDQAETQILAHLEKTICLKDGDVIATSQDLQLVVLPPLTTQVFKERMHKPMQITGTLFFAVTGHHHTSILMLLSQS